MVINHNLNAMSAHRNMSNLTVAQGKAMEKLNSGLRVNRASDDAAGLAISEKMRSQIRGLNQASRNAQDGISMIQTAEGALSEVQAIGHRMRELAIQSANGIYTDDDRKLIDQEYKELKKEIDRIANETEFNGSKVLNGDKSGKKLKVEDKSKNNPPNPPNGKLNDIFKGSIDQENLKILGEGNFEIEVTALNGANGGAGNNIDLNIKLKDNSKFNDNKEYIMDEITIKNASSKQTAEKVKIGDLSFNLDFKAPNTITNGDKLVIKLENTIDRKETGVDLQVGAAQNQTIGFDIDFMRSRELGLGGTNLSTFEDSQEAIKRVDEAISRVSSQRADLGASQNRLEHAIASSDNTSENLQAAESRIRDVDMAKEMMNLTKLNVLQQATQAMLSQANQAPQQVLSLLK